MPAPDTSPYRVFRSGDLALIRREGQPDIELPVADALAMAGAIGAALGPFQIRRRWTDADDAELRELYGAALSAKEIAARLGRTELAVTCRRNWLGIPAKHKKKADAMRLRHAERRAAQ